MTIPRVRVGTGKNNVGSPPEQADGVVVLVGYSTLGVVGTIYSFDQASASKAKTTLGAGKLAHEVGRLLNTPKHSAVHAITAASSAGSNSAVTQGGSSPPTGALTGTPVDDFKGKVEILAGGARGTATFRWAVDQDESGNYVNWSVETVTAATVLLGDTGLTFTFAVGTYAVGHFYTWTSTAPTHSNTQITDALDVLIAAGLVFDAVGLLQAPAGALDSDRATAMASLFGAVGTKMDALETAGVEAEAFIEAGAPVATDVTGLATWAAALKAAAPALLHERVGIVAGYGWRTSDLDARVYRRSALGVIIERIASTEMSVHPGEVETGALRGVDGIEWDESTMGGLDAYRYTTLRSWPQQPGYYITRGQLFATPGDATVALQVLRIRNAAQRTLRAGLIKYANKRLRTNAKTGALTETQAREVETDLKSKLRAVIGPHVAAFSVVVDRTIDFLATGKLKGDGGFTPDGYAEDIDFTVSVVRAA